MLMEETSVALSDTRTIFLEDDDDILICMKRGSAILQTFQIPDLYLEGGYGGGMLLLSPSERYLVFSYYSGESEEAYILFEIRDSCLKLVYGSGFLRGEGASYIFSQNEELLYQALPESVGPWYREDVLEEMKEEQLFDFCQVNVLDIQKKAVARHNIQVVLSERSDEEWAGGEPPCLVGIADDHLCIAMPWGEERLALPLKEQYLF